jgi:hypothetical protein
MLIRFKFVPVIKELRCTCPSPSERACPDSSGGWGEAFKTFFVIINFHPLLCALNDNNNSHTPSSFFTQG